MANERYGNNYLACIGKENSYGTKQATWEHVLPDKLDVKKTVGSVEVAQKTGAFLSKKDTEKIAGYTSGEVSLSGGLSPGLSYDSAHGILFEAFFSDSTVEVDTNAFEVPSVGTTPYSYTIYQLFNDDKAQVATGCVLESLGISGSSGGGIEYTADFRAKSVAFEQDESGAGGAAHADNGGDPFTSIPDLTPAIFADTTLTNLGNAGNITTLNSFSLDLTNIFQGDAEIYQNSNTKAQEILTGFEGSFTAEWNYDSGNDSDVYDYLMVDTLKSIVFTITDGTYVWTFTLYGKITEYTSADPDDGIFVSSLTFELMHDSSNIPISITIS